MLEMIVNRVLRSILIVVVGAAGIIAVIWFDVARHGEITHEAAAGAAAAIAVTVLVFLNRDRLGGFFHMVRRFLRKGGAR